MHVMNRGIQGIRYTEEPTQGTEQLDPTQGTEQTQDTQDPVQLDPTQDTEEIQDQVQFQDGLLLAQNY